LYHFILHRTENLRKRQQDIPDMKLKSFYILNKQTNKKKQARKQNKMKGGVYLSAYSKFI